MSTEDLPEACNCEHSLALTEALQKVLDAASEFVYDESPDPWGKLEIALVQGSRLLAEYKRATEEYGK